jgi:dTDP-4-amino-4,6-dideoxygalactose transaminase
VRVPLLDLPRQWLSVGADVTAAVSRVLVGGQYVLGPDVAALEEELAQLHGCTHGVGTSSGSDALLLALMALGVGPGDEVITTPLTFFSTTGAIVRLGATPVFADIDPVTFNLDVDAALRRVTPRTRAFVPVHLFGRPLDVGPLLATGIPVVEDAAQAVGSVRIGRGLLTTLSFFPSKNLGAAGDGGMVLTSDAAIADRLRLLRQHGSRPKYVHSAVGGNFRLDTLQAAILRAKLPHLAAWTERRRAHAAHYRARLTDTPLVLPHDSDGHVWHHFVVRVPEGREGLRDRLKAHEIDTEVYYPLALHLQPCFSHLGGRSGDLPHSERATTEVLALPVHPDLSFDQLDFVSDTIQSYYCRD